MKRDNKKKLGKKLAVAALLLVLSAYGVFATLNTVSGATDNPLQHFIFIVQENHSFDNYFGTYCNVQNNQCAVGINTPGGQIAQLAPAAAEIPALNASMDGKLRIDPLTNTTNAAPYSLGTDTNISIIGDELPPGVSDPENMPVGTTINSMGDISITGVPDNFNFTAAPNAIGAATTGTAPFPLDSESTRCCSHSWQTAHSAWDNGKMDGFVSAERNVETMGYYDRTEIPYYWDYADNYVLDDNFFSSLMGPSFPNHIEIASGQNGGQVDNTAYTWPNGTTTGCAAATASQCTLSFANMAQILTQNSISWKWYSGQKNFIAGNIWDVLPDFSYFKANPSILQQDLQPTSQFLTDVNSGNLPSVSWIIPGSWFPQGEPSTCGAVSSGGVSQSASEHPPARLDCGMDYVSALVNAVMQSQYWKNTAIIVTWDDYGGYYDNIPPPVVDAYGLGFRVPTLVISPYAKHGYIDGIQYEFASFLALIENRYGLAPLTARDAKANDMMNSFDFSQVPQPTLVEPANFLGPGSWPPQNNGYNMTSNSGTSSSTTSSSSSSSFSHSSTSSSSSSSTSRSHSSSSSSSSSSSTSTTSTITTSSSTIQNMAGNDDLLIVAIAATSFVIIAIGFALRKKPK